jgi:hypothetical protein
MKLNLNFFTLSTERSRRVFIVGLSRCLGQNWGSGGPLVRPASHLTWSGGQSLWQHAFPTFDTLLADLSGHVSASHPLARLGLAFVPCRLLVSYCL